MTERDELGRFPAGTSGNPAGRPKGTKNHIVELKHKLEIAVRESLPTSKVVAIINKMAEMALEGNVQAAKLILDKAVSNARDIEDNESKNGNTLVVRIENATVAAIEAKASRSNNSTPQPVEGEFTEVKQ